MPGYDFKPIAGSAVDWDHPSARGLVFLSPMSEGSGTPRDLISRATGTVSAATWANTACGKGLNFAAGAYVSYTATTALQPTRVTALALVRPTDVSAGTRRIINTRTASNHGYVLTPSGATSRFIIGDGTTLNIASGTTTLVANTYYLIGGTYDGSNIRVWQDGLDVTSGSVTSSTLAYSSAQFVIGNETPGVSTTFLGDVVFAAVWNRALSAREMRDLALDPFGLFTPPDMVARLVGGTYRPWINRTREVG
jgi:hypothetical protein